MPRTTPFFRSSAPSVATDSETVKLQALLDADPTTMPFVKLSQLLPANEQVRAMTYQALCIRKSEKAQQADWAGEVAAMRINGPSDPSLCPAADDVQPENPCPVCLDREDVWGDASCCYQCGAMVCGACLPKVNQATGKCPACS